MKLGDFTELLIKIITLGQGKRIATYIAKKLGYESCNCDKRKKQLNNLKIKRW